MPRTPRAPKPDAPPDAPQPADPGPPPPALTTYLTYVYQAADTGLDEDGVTVRSAVPEAWLVMGPVKAVTYQAALDMARDEAKRRAQQADGEAKTMRLTVAAISERNWNQGTAIVELREVTAWEGK